MLFVVSIAVVKYFCCCCPQETKPPGPTREFPPMSHLNLRFAPPEICELRSSFLVLENGAILPPAPSAGGGAPSDSDSPTAEEVRLR